MIILMESLRAFGLYREKLEAEGRAPEIEPITLRRHRQSAENKSAATAAATLNLGQPSAAVEETVEP